MHYFFALSFYIIFIMNQNLQSKFFNILQKQNYLNTFSILFRRIILQVNSNNSLILVFKIKKFVNEKLFTLFARTSFYFVCDSTMNIFNIINFTNDNFMINEIKFLQTRIYKIKLEKKSKIFFDLKTPIHTQARFDRNMIKSH